jgi:carbohydrate-selective porin OprB
LLPGRPDDVAYLGLVHASFGSRYSEGARLADPAGPAPDFEQAIEAGYILAASENWSVQADLQLVRHPGGDPGERHARVALLRIRRSF